MNALKSVEGIYNLNLILSKFIYLHNCKVGTRCLYPFGITFSSNFTTLFIQDLLAHVTISQLSPDCNV